MIRSEKHAITSILIFAAAWWPDPIPAQEIIESLSPKHEIEAADLLPSTVVLLVAAPQASELVQSLLEHPLRGQLESLPAIEKAMKSEDLIKLKSAVSLFEAGMGARWPKVLRTITGGGLYIAFDSQTRGLVLLAKSSDVDTLVRFRNTVLAALPANRNGQVTQGNYRGFDAHALGGDNRMAVMDQWLLVTNRSELGKQIVDQYLDHAGDALAVKPRFTQALAMRDARDHLWGFVDIAQLRDAGVARELYAGRAPNALAELVFGGLLCNLQHTQYGTAALRMNTQGAQLSVATPHDGAWAGEERQYFFGPTGDAPAPPLIEIPDRLLALSAYRDMAQMWLRAGDLLNDKGQDQLAQADTQLTTFFSGKDFGEDILAALSSDIQIVATHQTFDSAAPQPAIKLPAFAFQFRMKNAQTTQTDLRRVFQSLIGFLNVVGAAQGQPQLDLDMEKNEKFQLVTAQYVPQKEYATALDAPINFNFSPTLGFAGDRLVLSSSRSLAIELLQQENIDSSAVADLPNTHARLDARTLQVVLADNQSQLVAQNMLEKGHSQAAAQDEIKLLLGLLNLLRDASLTLSAKSGQLQLSLDVRVAQPAQ